jgi:hypothetical protein
MEVDVQVFTLSWKPMFEEKHVSLDYDRFVDNHTESQEERLLSATEQDKEVSFVLGLSVLADNGSSDLLYILHLVERKYGIYPR